RSRISPASRYVSQLLKEDGRSVGYMERKKVADLITEYRGYKSGKRLSPEKLAEAQALMDADSALWAKYAEAIDAGAKAETIYAEALAKLGKSEAVSAAIIRSAGSSNHLVTEAAVWTRGLAPIAGAIGVASMIYDIASADEARRWHVAARELSG